MVKKTRNVDITLTIDGIKITQVGSVKFLGVMVDEHLNWKTHINNIRKKIAKNIGILSKVAYLLPANVLKSLYYTLIYSYLAYCNVCWASTYPTSLDGLLKLQKRAVRVITKSSYFTFVSTIKDIQPGPDKAISDWNIHVSG